MARTGNHVWVEGEDRLFANFDRLLFVDMQKAAKKGLQTAGMHVIADAQRNMRTAGHNHGTLNNTGRLSQSGRVQNVPNTEEVEIGFFSDSAQRGYAAAVEYGSRAHWAPVQDIRAWVQKKLRADRKKINSIAFLINRAMSKKGTTAHPFFAPAVEKNKRRISNAIADAIRSVIDKDRI